MLDTTTKKRIDDCRDILVGKLPDPKAQIEQITIALIYKFMDDMDKEAIELGGKAKFFSNYTIPDPKDPEKEIVVEFEKYSWDNLFDTKVTANEMLSLYSDAIAAMDKNPNIPQLFRDIFKNAFLPYRDPETLKLFLKTIGEFEYTHSEKLGDAFEYLLSVMGSQGDAGQFRTPRHIIDFLVAVVDPQKTDTILDPACGTAGFLISAFKYIMDGGNGNGNNNGRDAMHRVSTGVTADVTTGVTTNVVSNHSTNNTITPDERRRIISNFTGYDISPDMVRLSLVNLYLHGFSDPHIWEYDTLSSEDRWNETADVILANPPFMSPKGGIRPHKKFSISSNRSEVLFVDYIAEHLNPKGRAGIIVPEGVIFQSGTAYKDLRKMLVENYLYAVVSLPAGVFNPYSGVKTSILLMDKELAKTSDEILFVKIDNDGYSLGAQRNPIKGGQLDDAIAIIRSFVCAIKNDKTNVGNKTNVGDKTDNADVTDNGNKTDNADETVVETQCIASLPSCIVETQFIPETQCIASLRTPHSQTTAPRNSGTNATENAIQNQTIAHTVPKSEIAKNGDYNLSGERYKVLKSNFKPVYELFKIEEITIYQQQGINTTTEKLKYENNGFIILQSNNISGGTLNFEDVKFISEEDFNRFGDNYKPKFNDILYSNIGSKLGYACVVNKEIPFTIAWNVLRLVVDTTKVIPYYFSSVLNSSHFRSIALGSASQSTMPFIAGKIFKTLEIPLPPISIQQEIVAEIEGYQKIIDGAKMVVDNYKPQIDIDPDWEMVELGGLAKNLDGKRVPITKSDRDEGKYPYYGASGIVDYVADYIFDDNLLLISEDGANLLARVTPIAFSVSGKVWVNNHAHVLKFDQIETQKFVELYLNSIPLDNYITGSAQPKLNQKALNSILIPLPDIDTQRQIVSRIEQEQELVNANKQLIEIFEKKIKDRIAKVWGE